MQITLETVILGVNKKNPMKFNKIISIHRIIFYPLYSNNIFLFKITLFFDPPLYFLLKSKKKKKKY